MSAEIIAFPIRPVPEDGQQRLRRAVAALDAALTAQREAVAEWRAALMHLHAAVHGLGDSLQQYRSNLDRVGTQLTTVNQQAQMLESWADRALACTTETG